MAVPKIPLLSEEDTPTAVLVARCWGPSLNLRRQAALRSWQRLANASVSGRGDAKEEDPSVKQDPM